LVAVQYRTKIRQQKPPEQRILPTHHWEENAMFRAAVCAGGLLLALVAVSYGANNELPAEVKTILEKTDTFEVWSLDPDKPEKAPAEHFRGYKVLGKTKMKAYGEHTITLTMDRYTRFTPKETTDAVTALPAPSSGVN
jgi:hypothetical protein